MVRRFLLWIAWIAVVAGSPVTQASEKVFVHALEGPPESFDFSKTATERANRVAWLMSDALLNVSKDGKRLEPGLAESWTLSPDGLRVVMRLRAGVTFHDGTALDARAAKDSLERQFRPGHPLYTTEPKNAKEQLLRDLIESIEIQNDLTLSLKLKYSGLHYLSQVEVASPSALAKLGKEFGRAPVYTGPFKFESVSKEQIVLSANDKYWAGRPKIDRVVFRLIPESKAVVEALMKGDVDFIPVLADPIYFDRVRQSPGIKLLPVPGLNVFYLGFYTERPPLSSPVLRRAVTQAVNVQRAAQFLGRGAAVTARGPLPPEMMSYDVSASQPPYDPEAAKEQLAKGGFDKGLALRLVHNSAVTFMAEMAGAIQNDLGRVGIKVELIGKPSYPEVVKAVRAREGDMFLYSWHVRAPQPERILVPLFHSRSIDTSNLTHYRNQNLDRMLDEALRLPEGPAETRLYSQIQKLIVAEAPMTFLYHAVRMAAYSERVQGLDLDIASLPRDKLLKVDIAP
jgi:peptide/nickel transport system substrate-binding protein